MASTATTYITSINESYPVAGVDNDTQGFRDNYANIKNGLQSVANEVSDIQATGVYKAVTNNLELGILQNGLLKSTGYSVKLPGTTGVQGNQIIDYANGNYQIWKISSATTFTFSNFPPLDPNDQLNIFSPVTLEIFRDPNTSTNYTVTFAADTSTNILLDYNPNTQSTNPITLTTCSSVLYEVARVYNNVPATASNKAYRIRFLGGPFKN